MAASPPQHAASAPSPAELKQGALPTFLVLSAIFLASLLLPVPGPDGRIAHLPTVCPFYELTGLPCPGCGLTRAFVCLSHGHWQEALHWHPVGWLVYALFVLLWLRAGVTLATGRACVSLSPAVSRRLTAASAVGLLLVGVVRIVWLTTHHVTF